MIGIQTAIFIDLVKRGAREVQRQSLRKDRSFANSRFIRIKSAAQNQTVACSVEWPVSCATSATTIAAIALSTVLAELGHSVSKTATRRSGCFRGCRASRGDEAVLRDFGTRLLLMELAEALFERRWILLLRGRCGPAAGHSRHLHAFHRLECDLLLIIVGASTIARLLVVISIL